VQEYIAGIDNPERREKFVKELLEAEEGVERFQTVLDTAPEDVKTVLLSRVGWEIRAVFVKLKPASLGCLAALGEILLRQYHFREDRGTLVPVNSPYADAQRQLLTDMASLARKVVAHVVAQDPARDLQYIAAPRGTEDYKIYKGAISIAFGPMSYHTLYSSKSLANTLQNYSKKFGDNHTDDSIHSLIYELVYEMDKWPKERIKDFHDMRGLLCGMPDQAILDARGGRTKETIDDLPGIVFGCNDRNNKSIQEFVNHWMAILKYSGMNDLYESSFIENRTENPFSTLHALRGLIENDPDNPLSNAYVLGDTSADNAKDLEKTIRGKSDNPFSSDESSSDDNPV
jgi:hypothetical protein